MTTAGRRTTITLGNTAAEVERARGEAEAFGRAHGLPERTVLNLSLACEELLTNLIKYGYADAGAHRIVLRISINDGSLDVVLEDDGRPFDPTAAPPPDTSAPIAERPIGGLGLHIVRRLAQNMTYERRGPKNRTALRLRIEP